MSGGNQQKVVFAKALAGTPAVLLLDEPTRGVDVGAKFDIYALIRDSRAAGMSVLIASSDFAELIGMCDRIVVMGGGAISTVLDWQGSDARRSCSPIATAHAGAGPVDGAGA